MCLCNFAVKVGQKVYTLKVPLGDRGHLNKLGIKMLIFILWGATTHQPPFNKHKHPYSKSITIQKSNFSIYYRV